MSVNDIRGRVARFKSAKDDEELAEKFTDAFSGVLQQALTDINSGRIKIEDVNDIGKMYNMWKDVTNFTDKMSSAGSSGALPELSTRASSAIDTKKIELIDDMSDEDMRDMIMGTMAAANDDNAAEFVNTGE